MEYFVNVILPIPLENYLTYRVSEEQARMAVEIVLDYLKDKLPSPFDTQIDAVLAGGDVPGDLLKGIGGMFAKK